MSRFILRIQGKGAISSADIEHVRALPNVKVLDTSSRMLLVEGPEDELKRQMASMPGWIMSPERVFSLPDDPRPRLH